MKIISLKGGNNKSRKFPHGSKLFGLRVISDYSLHRVVLCLHKLHQEYC